MRTHFLSLIAFLAVVSSHTFMLNVAVLMTGAPVVQEHLKRSFGGLESPVEPTGDEIHPDFDSEEFQRVVRMVPGMRLGRDGNLRSQPYSDGGQRSLLALESFRLQDLALPPDYDIHDPCYGQDDSSDVEDALSVLRELAGPSGDLFEASMRLLAALGAPADVSDLSLPQDGTTQDDAAGVELLGHDSSDPPEDPDLARAIELSRELSGVSAQVDGAGPGSTSSGGPGPVVSVRDHSSAAPSAEDEESDLELQAAVQLSLQCSGAPGAPRLQ